MKKYGMKYRTIKYYQEQSNSLMYYNGIQAGRYAFTSQGMRNLSAREIGHSAIMLAQTAKPEVLKAYVSGVLN